MADNLEELKKHMAEMRADFHDAKATIKRIERSCEFLAENQARLSSALHELTHNVTELSVNVKTISQDLAKVGKDMKQLVTVASALIHALEEHTGDGHGGKPDV
jgi:archaellum component FlaC